MPVNPRSFVYALDATTGVGTLTLNRPERLNALTFEVYTELRDTFRALDTEPGVRAILITGAGRAFCAGGDVDFMSGLQQRSDLAAFRSGTLTLEDARKKVEAKEN